ncbi:hypothetical protein F8M41_020509 [Gigaspora margarita]|uniref:Uncharacterized protein n=1 Tax=Gigaspora margarita TaxID=4874 RepID=A0A8H4EJK3_GIGMA|nr:hypothetical protein F8M41_020509 [Gigaspora margarita]
MNELELAHSRELKEKIDNLELAHARKLAEIEEEVKTKSMENKWLEDEIDQYDEKAKTLNEELSMLRKENEQLKSENNMMLELVHKYQEQLAPKF